jgi:hypothetical protein
LTEREIEAKPTFNQGNFLTLAETFTGFQENPTSDKIIRRLLPVLQSILTARERAERRFKSTA